MADLLKFITCGSVDDGKSTLIGHMLYDAKLIFADQEESLLLDSKVGSRGGEIDYSLLLDGLMAEREQGITIDVAYRYFTTEKRSFIVADTPGHEEYTRNMAVGASFADLAVILVDASKGVLPQTRRHTRICSLMGIRHFVFAVNKMDLTGFEEKAFKKIRRDIKVLLAEFEYQSLAVIPVSATEGDNVTRHSGRMRWYVGDPVLSYLEEIDVRSVETEKGFTLPVQRVCRPDHTFRGFQGQVETGRISLGEEITVLPSREKAVVKSLLNAGKSVTTVEKGNAVTVQLDREIDVSRGCVLAKAASAVVSSLFTARILWMDEAVLTEGKNYLLQIGTKSIPAVIVRLKHKISVEDGSEVAADTVRKNEIAVCDISTSEKIVFDRFGNNQGLGALILVDRITHMTSACGIVEHPLRRSDNLTWHEMSVTREHRAGLMGQRPKTIWFTGLSGSGKSTLANEIEKRLFAEGRYTMLLDGDNIRMGLNRNLGFREQDRIENIRRISEVAKLMNDAGLIVLTSFVSPYRRDRRQAREIIGEENFIEIYVSTSLEECEKRDVKGLYKKARIGEIPNFTGISAPYEAPEHADIVVDTEGMTVDRTVDYILEKLGRVY